MHAPLGCDHLLSSRVGWPPHVPIVFEPSFVFAVESLFGARLSAQVWKFCRDLHSCLDRILRSATLAGANSFSFLGQCIGASSLFLRAHISYRRRRTKHWPNAFFLFLFLFRWPALGAAGRAKKRKPPHAANSTRTTRSECFELVCRWVPRFLAASECDRRGKECEPKPKHANNQVLYR